MFAPPRIPADVIHKILADEESCLGVFFHWRWPNGFVCPRCTGRDGRRIARRPAWRCAACGHHARVTAGTALHRTRVPLSCWLAAIILVGDRKQSVSALQLMKDLRLGCRETAWTMLHIIRDMMDDGRLLRRGLVEVSLHELPSPDVRAGATEADALVLGVERLHIGDDDRVPRFGRIRMAMLPRTAHVGDAFRAVAAPAAPGTFEQQKIAGLLKKNFFDWVNGTFHGISLKYLPAYAREFTFRFNHRRHESLIPSLLGKCLMQQTTLRRADLRSPRPLIACLRPDDEDDPISRMDPL